MDHTIYMEISFKDERLKKLCEDHQSLCRKYGNKQADKIMQRIGELQALENLYDAFKLPQLNLHPLHDEYEGCFAVNILQPFRIILTPENGITADKKTITKIKILNPRINYHK